MPAPDLTLGTGDERETTSREWTRTARSSQTLPSGGVSAMTDHPTWMRKEPISRPEPIALHCTAGGTLGAYDAGDGTAAIEALRVDGLITLGAEEARRLAHWLEAFADSRTQTADDPGAGEGPGSSAPHPPQETDHD